MMTTVVVRLSIYFKFISETDLIKYKIKGICYSQFHKMPIHKHNFVFCKKTFEETN